MRQDGSQDSAPLIAIIDTDPALRELLRDFLADEGYDTVLCPDPSSAVSTIRSRPPDVVLINLWLDRRRTGTRIMTELQRHESTAALPVILLSTEAGTLDELSDTLSHQDYHEVIMPFELTDLLEKVTIALAARSSQSQPIPHATEDASLNPNGRRRSDSQSQMCSPSRHHVEPGETRMQRDVDR